MISPAVRFGYLERMDEVSPEGFVARRSEDTALAAALFKVRADAEAEPEAEPAVEPEPEAAVEPEDVSAEAEAEVEPEAEAEESVEDLVELPDGETVPLSALLTELEELRSGGTLRRDDYTRKTQELAEQRRLFEAREQQVEAELGTLAQQLRSQLALNPLDSPEVQKLRQEDPAQYLLLKDEYEGRQRLLADAESRKAQVTQERLQRAIPTEMSLLQEADPSFRLDTPVSGDSFNYDRYEKVGQYVVSQGIPPEEWSQVIDHRWVLLAAKAMEQDSATRETPKLRKRLVKTPRIRPGTGSDPNGEPTAQAALKQAMDNLRSNPNDRHAAAGAFLRHGQVARSSQRRG